MILVVGEILFDLFPDEKRLGGAAFNFACHLKHLGCPVRFVSRVGTDGHGKAILDRLAKMGFDPTDVQVDPLHPTGTVHVQLDASGVPAFKIMPKAAYAYIDYLPDVHSDYMDHAKILYFGTLAQRTPFGFSQIQHFLKNKGPRCRALYDINLRPACYSTEVVRNSLAYSDILKLNAEELQKVLQMTGCPQASSSESIRRLMAAYALQTVALTKGAEGCELHTADATHRVPAASVDTLADTVGAGDAYAAILAIGLLRKWPPRKTMTTAAAFAASICTIRGAVPDSKVFYAPFQKHMESEM